MPLRQAAICVAAPFKLIVRPKTQRSSLNSSSVAIQDIAVTKNLFGRGSRVDFKAAVPIWSQSPVPP